VRLSRIAVMINHHGTPGCRYTGIRSVESDVGTFTSVAEERKMVFSDYDARSIQGRFKFGCSAILADFQVDRVMGRKSRRAVSTGWVITGEAIQESTMREAAAAWLA
jgi:hypothetical protein